MANLIAHRYKPGESGNPGGRSDLYAEAQRICREASPDAAREMVALISDPDPRIRLMAADKIIERAWGKPRDYDPKLDADKPKPVFDPQAYTPAELEQLEVALKLLMENRTVAPEDTQRSQLRVRTAGSWSSSRLRCNC